MVYFLPLTQNGGMGMRNGFVKIVLVLMIILNFCLADVLFQPGLGFGLESNDNLDQVPTDSVYSAAARSTVGFSFSGYFNPDFLGDLNYTYKNIAFTNSRYGGFVENFGGVGFAYDLWPQLNIGYRYNSYSFADSLISDNNYNNLSSVPKISFYITPYTSLVLNQELSNLSYLTSTEKIITNKTGGYISQQFFEIFTLGLGSYSIQSEATTSSSNYTGKIDTLMLIIGRPKENSLLVEYNKALYDYADWYQDRQDNNSYCAVEYQKKLNDLFNLKLYWNGTINDSKDDNYDFKNNVVGLSLAWEPVFGSLYPTDDTSDLEYYYNSALTALENKDYGTAEKQLRKTIFWADEYTDAHFELGYMLHEQGRFSEAVKEFEKVIAQDDTREEAYYLLGYDYLKLEQKDKAIVILKKLDELNKDNDIKVLIMDLEN